MRLLQAIPALPVRDIEKSVQFYRDQLDFEIAYQERGFAIVRRDSVEIHIWAANDETWRNRSGSSPVVSGAESFIAGTASCRVQLEDVDALHRMLHPRGVMHPNGQLEDKQWGTREFAVRDLDNNLITFYERRLR